VAFSIINIIHILVLTCHTFVQISLILWTRSLHTENMSVMCTNRLVNLRAKLHMSFLISTFVNHGLSFSGFDQERSLKDHKDEQ